MNEKKIIAVTGATGLQGGGLARAILADPDGGFAVRAITRNPDSDRAKALADLGAEVVVADMDDAGSMRAAFTGAHGAYCVTNFWEHFSPAREMQQATNMAQAARGADVKHVIWSTLEDSRKWIPLEDERMPTLQGKYKVPHFDSKGEADGIFTSLGLPVTFLLTSFYWDNLINFGMAPKKGPDGKYAFTLPIGKVKFPSIAAEDIGGCAYGIFQDGEEFIGKTVGVAGAHLTGAEMAAAMTNALGVPVLYNEVSPAVYRGFGFPGADDLGNMFQFNTEFAEAFLGARSLDVSRKLNPTLQGFQEWLKANKHRIPLD